MIDVEPAKTHPASSVLEGFSREVTVRQRQLATLTLCDRFGNRRRNGGDDVRLVVRRDVAFESPSSPTKPAELRRREQRWPVPPASPVASLPTSPGAASAASPGRRSAEMSLDYPIAYSPAREREAVQTAVLDCGDGCFRLSVECFRAGRYVAEVIVNGENALPSPIQFLVW
eukprot:5682318-Pleurochrysis_carterae.AAC.1